MQRKRRLENGKKNIERKEMELDKSQFVQSVLQ